MQIKDGSALVEVKNLSFAYADSQPLLTQLNFSLGVGKIGLIGDNGSGKTTLLRLLAGELKPSTGQIVRHADFYFLKQSHLLPTEQTIADFLQVRDYLVALERVESGNAQAEDFDLLDGHWNLKEDLKRQLSKVGLSKLTLDRTLSQISGGEATLLALAALEQSTAKIGLLDEPSNNLDQKSRRILYQIVSQWPGLMIISTHDRALLGQMDQIIELYDGQALIIEGNYQTYQAHCQQLEESQQHQLLEAQKELKKIEKQAQIIQQRQAKQVTVGKKASLNKRGSKKSMNALKRKAQVSAGKEREQYQARLAQARSQKEQAEKKIRDNKQIRISELNSASQHRKQILLLEDQSGTKIRIGGGERVTLTGENGIGKSRLLTSIFTDSLRQAIPAWASGDRQKIALIKQNVLDLDNKKTLLAQVQSDNDHQSEQELRAQLARMLFKKDTVYKKVGELSGGQRFHVALAKLLVHRPAYELIILDEPTNNLDLSSLQQVENLLQTYTGSLLVVSHDQEFLTKIGIERTIHLDRHGLTELTK